MAPRKRLARHLANAFLSGEWTPQALEKSGQFALQWLDTPLLRILIADIISNVATPYAPSADRLTVIIKLSSAFERGYKRSWRLVPITHPVLSCPQMRPIKALASINCPVITNSKELEQWLGIDPGRLDWFADIAGHQARTEKEALQHYTYRWLPKKSGPPRLLEVPKLRLKTMQRRILHEILDRLPAHDAAHGYVKRRSVISAAQKHAGEHVVVTLDLAEFFPSTPMGRVYGLFRCLGYPHNVARLLTGLCSTRTPPHIFTQLPKGKNHPHRTHELYRHSHLPQGAPTSPSLANLCARAMDTRLAALAKLLDFRYTRYADDLAFSGDEQAAIRVKGLIASVSRIASSEGYRLNRSKTRIRRRGQRQIITGLIVNEHVNIPRRSYDILKATLHNCVRFGPASQNRDGHPDFYRHLDGRITWVENVNPLRGYRLRLLFEKIEW